VRTETKAAKFHHFRPPNDAGRQSSLIFLDNLGFFITLGNVNTTRRGGRCYRIWLRTVRAMASDYPDRFRIRVSQQLEGAFEAMVPKPLPAVERMLRAALRVAITSYPEDLSTFEPMLDLDGCMWIDRLSSALEGIIGRATFADDERIVQLACRGRSPYRITARLRRATKAGSGSNARWLS
jgi:hypothetical protein